MGEEEAREEAWEEEAAGEEGEVAAEEWEGEQVTAPEGTVSVPVVVSVPPIHSGVRVTR